MSRQYKVCVLGAGSFGTAMAQVAAANKYIAQVMVYDLNFEIIESIKTNGRNPKFFNDYKLSENITGSHSIEEAIADSAFIISCIPVQRVRPFLQEYKQLINKTPFLSCSKGIIAQTGQLISQVVREELPESNYAALSGPSFALEIMKKRPTMVVVASESERIARLMQMGLTGPYFSIQTVKDVAGVELAGALKNVLAIGAGVIEGARYGINLESAFLTRGVMEMQLFAEHFGSDTRTFYGLAGIGDLMLTSFGELSRNRQFGARIGQGETLNQILANSKGVVEGVATMELVYRESKRLGLHLPLTFAMHRLVRGEIKLEEALQLVMDMESTVEAPQQFQDLLLL